MMIGKTHMTQQLTHRLLVVTGLTPQVVTETLYALYRNGAVPPASIHVLTTAEGCRRIQLTLLNAGWLARFYHDYTWPAARFDASHIHVLHDAHGRLLEDIRSEEDNRAVADGITQWMKHFTSDPDSALHVSIAGGRKTMGFYAGYALSLYGRIQDRLSHVLVSSAFESHPEFYYPTPYSRVIYANEPTRRPLDTQHADVILADIPFVRLRHGLDPALLEGQCSFSQAVAVAQRTLGPAQLTLDPDQRHLIAHGRVIKMKPSDWAFYAWLAQRQKTGCTAPRCPCEGSADMDYAQEYLTHYRSVHDALGDDRTMLALREGMSKAFFQQHKSRVNRLLKQRLGAAAQDYLIRGVGKRPHTRYRIDLRNEQICHATGEKKNGY